jgi:NDP-sugar pyrophosphorylase family protein
LASNKNKVMAVRMNNTDLFIDVGNPETYWHALKITYNEMYSYQGPRNQSYSFF